MAEQIVMPKLAMAMKKGTVVEWKAAEGEWVEKEQMVMVVETEKVTYECESPAAGFLHMVAELKKKIPVNKPVAYLAATEAELAELQAGGAPAAAEPGAAAAPVAAVGPQAEAPARAAGERIKSSPLARAMANQHGLDLARIPGTGPGGRIVKRDIEAALAAPPAEPEEAAAPSEELEGKRVKASFPLEGMRRAIADHMVDSLAVSAQLSYMGEFDMSGMVELREKLVDKAEQIGARISYNDLMIKVVAKAVKDVPLVNSSLVDEEIVIWEDINIGVAVAFEISEFEGGLIVPVVKDAYGKTLSDVSKEMKDLATRARDGQLTADDVADGTITISNVGMMAPGWTVSTPILNQPQTVIVQPGAIVDKPVVVDGEIVIRPMMSMSLTFDHRVLDGMAISKFFKRLRDLIEDPDLLLV